MEPVLNNTNWSNTLATGKANAATTTSTTPPKVGTEANSSSATGDTCATQKAQEAALGGREELSVSLDCPKPVEAPASETAGEGCVDPQTVPSAEVAAEAAVASGGGTPAANTFAPPTGEVVGGSLAAAGNLTNAQGNKVVANTVLKGSLSETDVKKLKQAGLTDSHIGTMVNNGGADAVKRLVSLTDQKFNQTYPIFAKQCEAARLKVSGYRNGGSLASNMTCIIPSTFEYSKFLLETLDDPKRFPEGFKLNSVRVTIENKLSLARANSQFKTLKSGVDQTEVRYWSVGNPKP